MVLCMSVRPFFLKHGRGLSDSLQGEGGLSQQGVYEGQSPSSMNKSPLAFCLVCHCEPKAKQSALYLLVCFVALLLAMTAMLLEGDTGGEVNKPVGRGYNG